MLSSTRIIMEWAMPQQHRVLVHLLVGKEVVSTTKWTAWPMTSKYFARSVMSASTTSPRRCANFNVMWMVRTTS